MFIVTRVNNHPRIWVVRHLVDAATNRLRQQLTLLSHSVPTQQWDSAISIELFLVFHCWLAAI